LLSIVVFIWSLLSVAKHAALQAVSFGNTMTTVFNGPSGNLPSGSTFTYTSAAVTIGAGQQLVNLAYSMKALSANCPWLVTVLITRAVGGTVLHTFSKAYSTNTPDADAAFAFNYVTPSLGTAAQSVIVKVTIAFNPAFPVPASLFNLNSLYDYITMTMVSAV
jgi:hypothetical protein